MVKNFIIFLILAACMGLQAANAQNSIWIDSVQAEPGHSMLFSVKVDNAQPFVAFQCDIQLPQIVSYIEGSASLTSRANGHSLSASTISPGLLRIIAYSLDARKFLGNTGAVLTFSCRAGTTPNASPMPLTSVVLSDSLGASLECSARAGLVTVLAPNIVIAVDSLDFGRIPLGQSSSHTLVISNNGTTALSISRVRSTHSEIRVLDTLGAVIVAGGAISREIRFEPVVKGTKLGVIQVLSDDPDDLQRSIAAKGAAYAVNEMHIGSVSGRSGHEVLVSIGINNMEAFTAFEVLVPLPGIAKFIAGTASLSVRKRDHIIVADTATNNELRIVGYSPGNQRFDGDDGKLAEFGLALNGAGGDYALPVSTAIIGDSLGTNIISASYAGAVNIAAPSIALESLLLDIGRVSTRDSSTAGITVQNTGNDTLVLSSIVVQNQVFVCTDTLPLRIPPGSSQIVHIKFRSALVGTYEGSLVVYHNDVPHNPTTITLRGQAYNANTLKVVSQSGVPHQVIALPFAIDNVEQFVAFQFDVSLPSALVYQAGSAVLSARSQGHSVAASVLPDGKIRIIAFSTSQTPFLGDTGEVVRIYVILNAESGSYPVTVSNAIIANTQNSNILSSIQDGSVDLLFAQTLAAGWNMIGLPGAVTNAHYLSVVPNAVPGSLYAFYGTYNQTDTMRMGIGYWLKMPSAMTVAVDNIPAENESLTLAAGWNIIAGPSCPVAYSSISDPQTILIAGTLYGYNGGYYPATVVERGKGYWVKARAAGSVALACSSVPKQAPEDPVGAKALSGIPSLVITDASGARQLLYWDIRNAYAGTPALFSLPPIPPAGCFDARFEGDQWLDRNSESMISVQSYCYPLTIAFEHINPISGEGCMLVEMAGEREGLKHAIVEGVSITVSDPNIRRLKLRLQNDTPAVFCLEQNYPNPFNPATRIGFGVPGQGSSWVKLVVYDVLGREVGVLVNEEKKPGEYAVTFNGSTLGSGVYYYRLTTNGFTATKSMVLAK